MSNDPRSLLERRIMGAATLIDFFLSLGKLGVLR